MPLEATVAMVASARVAKEGGGAANLQTPVYSSL